MSNEINTTAKTLRKRPADTENVLWRHLRAKQIEGLKFRRQEPIGKYIVDFVCHEKRMVVEVDGGQHSIDKDRDNERDRWLKEHGDKVLRFWNNEVLMNITGVLEVIRENCIKHPPLTPPIKGGEIRRGYHRKVGRTKKNNNKETKTSEVGTTGNERKYYPCLSNINSGRTYCYFIVLFR